MRSRKFHVCARGAYLPMHFLKPREKPRNSLRKASAPAVILNNHLAQNLPPVAEDQNTAPASSRGNIRAIQDITTTRIDAWKRLIRESFARHESIFICVPTRGDVERLAPELSHGIEDYTFLFHAELPKKRLLEKWVFAIKTTHPIVVIGTPQYLMLPRYFNTIVLDEEHVRGWNTFIRPAIDLRIFVEHYAKASGSMLILGAPILRPETHERIRHDEITEFGRIAPHARLQKQEQHPELVTEIIDPRPEEKRLRERDKQAFVVLSEKIQDVIAHAFTHREHVVLLAARTGLAPVTVCRDCGTLVRCPACDTPLVMHKTDGGKESEVRVFSCHACGLIRLPEKNLNETCHTCGGWRLIPLGIGIEGIEEGVARIAPNMSRFVIGSHNTKTRTQAEKIVAQFEKTPAAKKTGAVLIGTPAIVPLLPFVHHTAIISIDSLFSIPDIRMSERIFALILALREKTTRTLLIQTRADDTTLITQALDGNLTEFIDTELALRRAFAYPPFGTIVKITLRGPRATLVSEMTRLKEFLSDYAPLCPNTCTREARNIFHMHAILKLPGNATLDKTLLAKLRALPRTFTIEVNPDHLL
ncbi:MAG: Primosomal protein [Parcubacteria group bacterium GW2011_GWA1_47_8]|nr:MAG: Primosomal protein [Parcubacteria group bacterium GW2011_GWA1_47_8]